MRRFGDKVMEQVLSSVCNTHATQTADIELNKVGEGEEEADALKFSFHKAQRR